MCCFKAQTIWQKPNRGQIIGAQTASASVNKTLKSQSYNTLPISKSNMLHFQLRYFHHSAQLTYVEIENELFWMTSKQPYNILTIQQLPQLLWLHTALQRPRPQLCSYTPSNNESLSSTTSTNECVTSQHMHQRRKLTARS